MKRPNLTLAPLIGRTHSHDKYAGEPDSPNFRPSSPLIDRRRLSMRQEAELKRACAIVFANAKLADEDLRGLAYLKDVVEVGTKRTKHDKHSSFTFSGPKPTTDEAVSTASRRQSKPSARKPSIPDGEFSDFLQPVQTQPSRKSKHSFADLDQEALHDIRKKIDNRPKTSAAACVDYNGAETSSSSNRTSRSTPFTSAAITPGSVSKRFSQVAVAGEMAVEGVEPIPQLPEKKSLQMDPDVAAQARSWLAEEFARRREKEEKAQHNNEAPQTLRPFHPQPYQPNSAPVQRPGSRSESIKNSIREYIRPGSSSSRAESIHSNASKSSNIRSQFSAIRQKFSRRGSSSSSRPGRDDGDEYFINASQVQFDLLNRPLPPLPGLDTWVEPTPRARHVADLLMGPRRKSHNSGECIVNENGIEEVLSVEEKQRRQEEMSRAVLEKMTTGSIGSGGVTSPATRMSIQTRRESGHLSAEDAHSQRPTLSRPGTSGSEAGKTLGIRLVPDEAMPHLRPNGHQRMPSAQEMAEKYRTTIRVKPIKTTPLISTTGRQQSATATGTKTPSGLKSPKSPWKRFFHIRGKSAPTEGMVA